MKRKDKYEHPMVKCYSCGKPRHMSYDCRSKKPQRIEAEDGVQFVENQALTLYRAATIEKTTREKIPRDIWPQPRKQAVEPMKETIHFV